MPSLDFEYKRPNKLPFYKFDIINKFIVFWYLIKHTFTRYEKQLENPDKQITNSLPQRRIEDNQLTLCKEIFDTVENRTDKLELKASILLSVVAFLIPIALSLIAYTVTKVESITIRYIVFCLDIVSLVLLLSAFVAAMRVTIVKGRQSLYLGAIINDEDAIKPYDVNEHGRGLLFCASYNNIINDIMADFIRACHIFIVMSILSLTLSSAPVLYYAVNNKDVQDIKGHVVIDNSRVTDKIYSNLSTINQKLDALPERIHLISNKNKSRLNRMSH